MSDPSGARIPLSRTFVAAFAYNNPVAAQLLGLCPLLAVSNNVVNALGLSLASVFVIVCSNALISLARKNIPDISRLACFVLVIATFTTLASLLLEAFAFTLYERVALFVQLIVTNCMILGRAEAFASRQPLAPTFMDSLGTGLGFAVIMITLGATRELLSSGTLLTQSETLFGTDLTLQVLPNGVWPLAQFAPGAFIVIGVLLGLGTWLIERIRHRNFQPAAEDEH